MSSGATGNTPGNEVSNWTLAEMSAGSMSLAELLQEPLILTRSDLRTHRRRATMPFGSHVSSRRAVSNASWLTRGVCRSIGAAVGRRPTGSTSRNCCAR